MTIKYQITPISQILIIFAFILLVVATNAATFAAIKMSRLNYLIFVLLIGINLIIILCTFLFFKIDKDNTYIYLIEIMILCEILYSLSIKQIYEEDALVIEDLKEKDIIEEVTC
jgi:O-antigen/teichoic acid export membrane protein